MANLDTIEEVEGELAFQKVLLETCDPSVAGYDVIKFQIEQEIAHLTSQLCTLQGDSTVDSPSPQQPLPNNKRARAVSWLDGEGERAFKSHRTSPDPFLGHVSDEEDDGLPDNMLMALGRDNSARNFRIDADDFLRKAAEREKRAEERRARERADAELARSMQNSTHPPMGTAFASGSASGFGNRARPSNGSLFQSSLTPNGMLRHPAQPSNSQHATQSSSTSFSAPYRPKTSKTMTTNTPINSQHMTPSSDATKPLQSSLDSPRHQKQARTSSTFQCAPQPYAQSASAQNTYNAAPVIKAEARVRGENRSAHESPSGTLKPGHSVKLETKYGSNSAHASVKREPSTIDLTGNKIKSEIANEQRFDYNFTNENSSTSSLEEITAADFANAVPSQRLLPPTAQTSFADNPLVNRHMPATLDGQYNRANPALGQYHGFGSSFVSAAGSVANNISLLSRGAVGAFTAAVKREFLVPGAPSGSKIPDYVGHHLAETANNQEEIKKLLDSIRSDADLPAHMRRGTPEQMKVTLLEHQKVGLTWMSEKEESIGGSILADDMGLGKTIQALALMVARPSNDLTRKTTLIIAPVALLRQWETEIEEKIKRQYALSVYKYHSGQKADFMFLRTFDVVLTTFGKLTSEFKRWNQRQLYIKENPNIPSSSVDANPKFQLSLIGPGCKWHRVIIDEAQNIKNRNAQCSKAVVHLDATYRLCMTGTPMMNSVDELFPLLRFCRISPYYVWEKWNVEIGIRLKSHSSRVEEGAIKKLQALIRATMLRRTKTTILDGKPLVVLPERIVEDAGVPFLDHEQTFYTELQSTSQAKIKNLLVKGTLGKKYSCALVLLLRLRQACDHQSLVFFSESLETLDRIDVEPEKMSNLAKELSSDVVGRIKEADSDFECPVCFDATTNPCILLPCGHWLCGGCWTALKDASNINSEDHSGLRCPNCRGPLNAARITDYQAFKEVHQPELLTDAERAALEPAEKNNEENESSDSDSDSDTNSDEGDSETDSLDGFIVQSDDEDEDENERIGPSRKRRPHKNTMSKFVDKGKGKKRARKSRKPKEPKGSSKKKALAVLKKEGMRNASARRKYFRRLEKLYTPSAKIEKTIEVVREIDPEEKILIFSQFTSFLDLLQIGLERAGFSLLRYDGSMTTDQRSASVEKFKRDKSIPILLLSLKAGNAGLNLNFASQVLILDPFWNPFVEEQAMDRAHRIGQTRNVHVRRVVVPGTVEDRILALQEQKRDIINAALDETAGKKIGRLGVRELAYLFGMDERGRALPPTHRDLLTAGPSGIDRHQEA